MVRLPEYITKKIHGTGKNVVQRCYGREDVVLDNGNEALVKSRNPFIIEQDGKRILFTSNREDLIPDDCAYALLAQKRPTVSRFRNGELEFLEWLRHPSIDDDLSPDEVARSWRGKFTFIEEDKETGAGGLRIPQAEAIHAWLSSMHTRKDRATIVMPTGTGKTETMLGIMVSAQCKKILVTVPHDALREQIFRKFLTLGKLHEFGIVTDDCKYPYVSLVKSGMDLKDWQEIVSRSNVIVTTMPLLAGIVDNADDVYAYLKQEITHVFVDEAHHAEASSWSQFLDDFERTKITQFTATPFRNDGKKLKGEFVYSFSLRAAQQQSYYGRINFCPVYELDREKADQTIADKAVAILRHDRDELHLNHILMARCKDKKRAEQVFECYRKPQFRKLPKVFDALSWEWRIFMPAGIRSVKDQWFPSRL